MISREDWMELKASEQYGMYVDAMNKHVEQKKSLDDLWIEVNRQEQRIVAAEKEIIAMGGYPHLVRK